MKRALPLLLLVSFLVIPSVNHARSHFGLNYCHQPGFQCIIVKRGQSWQSLFPDEYQRQVVQRLNRMNIRLRRGMRIAVPDNLAQTDLLKISPFPAMIESSGSKMIVVDPGSLAWGAYDAGGHLVHWGPISGGKSYCRDVGRQCLTVSGQFSVYHKKDGSCESRKFPVGRGGAPMPYCMFFHGGYALHASREVPGYHASHGCVRLFLEDARWLNEEFVELPNETRKGTRVIVNPYQ